jgi:hypothetical protein
MTTLQRYALLLVVALLAAVLAPEPLKPTAKATGEALRSRG